MTCPTCPLYREREKRYREALEEDASGRSVPELLKLAQSLLVERGDGPVADCLGILAEKIESALAPPPAQAKGEEK